MQFVALSLLGFVPSKVLSYFISYEKLQWHTSNYGKVFDA